MLKYSSNSPAVDFVEFFSITKFYKLTFVVEHWDFRIFDSEMPKISKSNFKSFINLLKSSKNFDNEFLFRCEKKGISI